MEIITFIWLVICSVGIVALLLLVQEVRHFRSEARRVQETIQGEMLELKRLLTSLESDRLHRASREIRERLAATREGRPDAEQRIDVGRILDEAAGKRWQVASERFRRGACEADKEVEVEVEAQRKSLKTRILDLAVAQLPRLVLSLLLGLGVGALLMHLRR